MCPWLTSPFLWVKPSFPKDLHREVDCRVWPPNRVNASFSLSNSIMSPPDPPADFLPTHVVLRIMPRPFSSVFIGFIQDNGTSFMSLYLTPLASNLPYGQWAAPSATIYNLGGTSCVPGGSALCTPAPHDIAFTGPQLGGIPYGLWAAPSAAIYNLGGNSCKTDRSKTPHCLFGRKVLTDKKSGQNF